MRYRSMLIAALAAAIASPATAVAPDGDPILYWNALMLNVGYNPGQTRPAALLNIALFDTVNATLGRPNKAYIGHVANSGGDTRAAAAVAARNILVSQYAGRTAEFDAALASQLALVPDGPAKTAGMQTGAKFAAATLAYRAADGSAAVVPYTPSGLPGRWAPTPPGNLPAALPQQATMTSWLGMNNADFRAAPPPAIDSAAYAAAFAQVKDLGSATSGTRTTDQSQAVLFWAAASGPGTWIRATIDRSESEGFSTLENARILAVLSTGVADATIAVWDTKYHYDYWRPVTGIRNAGLDGNDATAADAGWSPYIITPNHPSYASAHSAVSSAAASILSAELGDFGNFCVSAAAMTRCWNSFDLAVEEAGMSRIWGGIHWSFDDAAGQALGRQVGEYALASGAFGVVPEPSAWMMLIMGFGIVGAADRRKRRASVPA